MQNSRQFLLFLCFSLKLLICFCENNITENVHISVPKHIMQHGYPIEIHKVTTEDGYILEMHRIPHGFGNFTNENRPVVLLQHGFLACSADWIVPGTKRGLGYLLADRGYDVWLGNARGNTYSRHHVTRNADKEKFWDFSWHEIGFYDLPAMIDYALNITGQEKLFYIGHSQGTTVFYVMCSMKPEYNKKIRAMISLAPAAYMSHMLSPFLRILARYYREIDFIFKSTGIHEFMPANSIPARSIDSFCNYNEITVFLCTNLFYLLYGVDDKAKYNEIMPIILSHMPAGSSTKQVSHYMQLINSGQFCQYDYDILMNMVKYQSVFPPKYDLLKVKAPVSLFYSHNDWLSAEMDVFKLHQELGNAVGLYLITDSEFNHLDYIWSTNVHKLVHKRIYKILVDY